MYALLEGIGGAVMAKALMMPTVSKEQFDVLISACKEANANACVAQLQLYQTLYGFNLSQLILLGIYGLGFCYVASSPGLVVHAVRRQLVSGSETEASKWTFLASMAFTVGIPSVIVAIPIAVSFCASDFAAASATLIAALFFVAWQIVLLRREYRQNDDLLDFYQQLHRARQARIISSDSYRHLREHGNAFFIVVLELMFFSVAMSLFKLFGHNPYWPTLLILWVVPGASVYFLGHRIEALLRKRYGGAVIGNSNMSARSRER